MEHTFEIYLNFIIKQIRLQKYCSVKPKDPSGAIKTKAKLGCFLYLKKLASQANVLLKDHKLLNIHDLIYSAFRRKNRKLKKLVNRNTERP